MSPAKRDRDDLSDPEEGEVVEGAPPAKAAKQTRGRPTSLAGVASLGQRHQGQMSQSIQDHDRWRQIENKVVELQDRLAYQGKDPQTIEEEGDRLREKLIAEMGSTRPPPTDFRPQQPLLTQASRSYDQPTALFKPGPLAGLPKLFCCPVVRDRTLHLSQCVINPGRHTSNQALLAFMQNIQYDTLDAEAQIKSFSHLIEVTTSELVQGSLGSPNNHNKNTAGGSTGDGRGKSSAKTDPPKYNASQIISTRQFAISPASSSWIRPLDSQDYQNSFGRTFGMANRETDFSRDHGAMLRLPLCTECHARLEVSATRKHVRQSGTRLLVSACGVWNMESTMSSMYFHDARTRVETRWENLCVQAGWLE